MGAVEKKENEMEMEQEKEQVEKYFSLETREDM